MAAFGYTTAVLFLALATLASATDFMQCKSFFSGDIGTPPLKFTIDTCDTDPCKLERGTSVTLVIDFEYKKDLHVLKPEIISYIGGILPISQPIDQVDGCESLTLNKCPIKAGTKARYEYTIFISPETPLTDFLIRLAFTDENDEITICAELTVKIVPNLNESDFMA